jgi:hypothetical protein
VESVPGIVMMMRSIMPDDRIWWWITEKESDRIFDRKYSVAREYINYLDWCILGETPNGSIEISWYCNQFLEKSLGIVFDYIGSKKTLPKSDQILKQIKAVTDLYDKKEIEIQELAVNRIEYSPTEDHRLFLSNEAKMYEYFIKIVDCLIELSKDSKSQSGKTALSILDSIRKIIILTNHEIKLDTGYMHKAIINDNELNFLKQNIIHNIYKVSVFEKEFNEPFNIVVPKGGQLPAINRCRFKKGGSIDLKNYEGISDYKYQIKKHNYFFDLKPTVLKEGNAANEIITLPENTILTIDFVKNQPSGN